MLKSHNYLLLLLLSVSCNQNIEKTVQNIEENQVSDRTELIDPIATQKKILTIPKHSVDWFSSQKSTKKNAVATSYLGTWIAEVGTNSIQTHNNKLLFSEGTTSLVEGILTGTEEKERCIWLELYDDYTGFWATCLQDTEGEPRIAYAIDFNSGKETASGLKFDWNVSRGIIHIRFEDSLITSYSKDTLQGYIKVKHWDLKLQTCNPNSEEDIYCIQDYFPEYHYRSPETNEFTHYPRYIHGKVEEYTKELSSE